MKNIIVFGNKQITIDFIRLLEKNPNANLVAIIGYETENDLMTGCPSIKQYCLKKGLIYFSPDKLDEGFLKVLKNLKPDLCFSILYRDIFPANYLLIAPYINLHPGMLPEYRGPVPYLWALLNNEKITGVTLHYIDKGIDSGDVIDQLSYKIPDKITGFELGNQLMRLGFQLLRKQLPLILKEKNNRLKQKHSGASYFGPYNNKLRQINWYQSAVKIVRQIQAFAKPYSGATGVLSGREIIIRKANLKRLRKDKLSGPGKIIKVNKNGTFIVSAIDNFILVEEFEMSETELSFKAGDRFELFKN